MGKVLSTFTNGWPGAISRSVDDVVVALANKSGAALPYGVPVALDSGKTGVVRFDANTHTAAEFVGITVRDPAKTPDAYGGNTGSYGVNELADVLVRGHIVAAVDNWTGALGDVISVKKSDGKFAVGSGNDYLALSNVRISGAPDGASNAELVITERNVL